MVRGDRARLDIGAFDGIGSDLSAGDRACQNFIGSNGPGGDLVGGDGIGHDLISGDASFCQHIAVQGVNILGYKATGIVEGVDHGIVGADQFQPFDRQRSGIDFVCCQLHDFGIGNGAVRDLCGTYCLRADERLCDGCLTDLRSADSSVSDLGAGNGCVLDVRCTNSRVGNLSIRDR